MGEDPSVLANTHQRDARGDTGESNPTCAGFSEPLIALVYE